MMESIHLEKTWLPLMHMSYIKSGGKGECTHVTCKCNHNLQIHKYPPCGVKVKINRRRIIYIIVSLRLIRVCMNQRFSTDLNVASSLPTYRARGRISRFSSYCSNVCAIHPAVRAIAKIGV